MAGCMTRLAQSHSSGNQTFISRHDSQGYDKQTADLVYKRIIITLPLLLFTAEESRLFSSSVTLPSFT